MVSINDVYITVQAILNKEQRGYVAPIEFNRYAEQAQLEILENYFVDKSHFNASRKGADMMQQESLREKIDIFAEYAQDLVYNTTTNRYTLPTGLYMLEDVYYETNDRTAVVDKIKHKGSRYIKNSPLTRPNITFPKYERYGNELEILPNTITSQTITDTRTSTDGQRGFLLQFTPFPNSVTVTVAGATTTAYTLVDKLITLTNGASLNSAVVITYKDDMVHCDYIRTPTQPRWGYTSLGANRTPLYNSSTSTNFELLPSEQYKLVQMILLYAGVQIREVDIVQFASNEQQLDNQNQKS